MANLDTNLIAKPGFNVQSLGNGKTITIQLAPKFDSVTGNIVGWADMMPKASSWLLPVYTESFTPYSVSPAVTDNITSMESDERSAGIMNFMDFLAQNAIHIKAMNLRATIAATIPQQIVILSPDVFSGQSARQVVDIASKKTAYQYQNDIITIDNLNLIFGRNSTMSFLSSFVYTPTGSGEAAIAETAFYIDLVIDYYTNEEKYLYDFINAK